jgi:hypothetical protein
MSDSSEFFRLRRLLNIVGGIAVAYLGAAVLLWRFFNPIPSFEKLTRFEETILGVSERAPRDGGEPTYYEIRFLGKKGKYSYPFWFPNSTVVGGLQLDDKVVVWSDVGDSYRIFQLQKDGVNLIAYDAVNKAARNDKRFDLGLAIMLGTAATYGVWRFSKNFEQIGGDR